MADHKVKNAASDKDVRIFFPKTAASGVFTPWTFTDRCYKRGRGGDTSDKLHPVPTLLRFAAAIKLERANISCEVVELLIIRF